MTTSRDERTALRAAMAAATARPWDTVQMTEDRDGCAVMAGHHHEGFVADTMFAPNATAIKLAANLAERLCDDVDQLAEVNDLINTERDRAFSLMKEMAKSLHELVSNGAQLMRNIDLTHRPKRRASDDDGSMAAEYDTMWAESVQRAEELEKHAEAMLSPSAAGR